MPALQRGDRINQYQVHRRLGEGRSAEVYEVRDTNSPQDVRVASGLFERVRPSSGPSITMCLQYALKIDKEKVDKSRGKSVLQQELQAIKELPIRGELSARGMLYEPCQRHDEDLLQVIKELQPCELVCALKGSGTSQDGKFFIVMELLGQNVAELRGRPRWSPALMKVAGLQMLDALEGMHRLGFIHRDVKPANFVMFPQWCSNLGSDEAMLKVIDFGLAKKFSLDTQQQQGQVGFRGSSAYASVNAHKEVPQGPRDDLWSWLYMLVEMVDGGLTWRGDREEGVSDAQRKQYILKRKQMALEDPSQWLTANVRLPEGLRQISFQLQKLGVKDEPAYDDLRALLEGIPDDPLQPKPTPPARRSLPQLQGGTRQSILAPVGIALSHQQQDVPDTPASPDDDAALRFTAAPAAQPRTAPSGQQPPGSSERPQQEAGASQTPAGGQRQAGRGQQQARDQQRASARGHTPPATADSNRELARQAAEHMKRRLAQQGMHQLAGRSEKRYRSEERDASQANGHKRSRLHDASGQDGVPVPPPFGPQSAAAPQLPHSSSGNLAPALRGSPQPLARPLPEVATAVQEVEHMVHRVQQGRVSESAVKLRDALCGLDPAESLGVVAWLVDSLCQVPPQQAVPVHQWATDLTAFCLARTQQLSQALWLLK